MRIIDRMKRCKKRFFFLCPMCAKSPWLMGWNGAQRWPFASVFANKCYDL